MIRQHPHVRCLSCCCCRTCSGNIGLTSNSITTGAPGIIFPRASNLSPPPSACCLNIYANFMTFATSLRLTYAHSHAARSVPVRVFVRPLSWLFELRIDLCIWTLRPLVSASVGEIRSNRKLVCLPGICVCEGLYACVSECDSLVCS